MEQKQLQKEAVQRLNVMIDELRNSQNADLSAKNLGEEGCIFISEGFAFNDRSAPPSDKSHRWRSFAGLYDDTLKRVKSCICTSFMTQKLNGSLARPHDRLNKPQNSCLINC